MIGHPILVDAVLMDVFADVEKMLELVVDRTRLPHLGAKLHAGTNAFFRLELERVLEEANETTHNLTRDTPTFILMPRKLLRLCFAFNDAQELLPKVVILVAEEGTKNGRSCALLGLGQPL